MTVADLPEEDAVLVSSGFVCLMRVAACAKDYLVGCRHFRLFLADVKRWIGKRVGVEDVYPFIEASWNSCPATQSIGLTELSQFL